MTECPPRPECVKVLNNEIYIRPKHAGLLPACKVVIAVPWTIQHCDQKMWVRGPHVEMVSNFVNQTKTCTVSSCAHKVVLDIWPKTRGKNRSLWTLCGTSQVSILKNTPAQKKPTTKKDIVTSGGQPETHIEPLPIEPSSLTERQRDKVIYA